MRQPRKDEERASVRIISDILPCVASLLETCPGLKEMAGCRGYLSVLPQTFRFDLRPELGGVGSAEARITDLFPVTLFCSSSLSLALCLSVTTTI